jgi:hypothetical protein
MLGLAALIWDYYKWRYAERVLLRVTANPGMVSTQNPKEKLIMVSVTNVGKIPTTINLLSLHGFTSKKGSKEAQWRKRGNRTSATVLSATSAQAKSRRRLDRLSAAAFKRDGGILELSLFHNSGGGFHVKETIPRRS